MLSSAYYLQQYTQHKRLTEKYSNWMEYLVRIRDKIDSNFDDDAGSVNNKIDNLVEDLKKGVRYNFVYTNHAEGLQDKKEKISSNDPKLSAASSSLGTEISRIQGLKAEQERLAAEAYQNYQTALEEERRAAMELAQSLLKL